MTKTNDIIKFIIESVAEETEISSERILSRERTTEVVDARHVAVMALVKSGIYTSRISETMNITPRYIQYIVTEFECRLSRNRPLRNKYEIIAKKLRNNLEITSL